MLTLFAQNSVTYKIISKDLNAIFVLLIQPVPEIKTITNASATSMEEVTPSSFSEAMLLAPQEILGMNMNSIEQAYREHT